MGIFSRIGLIPTPAVKRPRDLAYASMEKPPLATLAILAVQHAATALALIAYVLAAAHIGGLDSESTRKLISASIIGMALATRNLMDELRGAGMVTSGPPPFGPKDRSRFLSALDLAIVRLKRRGFG